MNIPVYLSHATPHTELGAKFLEQVKQSLLEYDIECVAIKSSDIRTNDAVSAIKEKMKKCYGLIALATERRFLSNATTKRGADIPDAEEKTVVQMKETTPYIQIETSVALAYDLPVVVLKEKGLIEEGVLEPYCVGITGPSFEISESNASFFSSTAYKEAIETFCTEVCEDFTQKNMYV